MKIIIGIACLLFFFGCRQERKGFAGQWTQLTKRDGQTVILQPCDVDLRQIVVNDSILHIVYPTETNTQPIKEVSLTKDGYDIIAGTTLYRFCWIQKDSGMAAWISYATPERPDSFVYVDSSHTKLFRLVKQPAKECE